MPKIVQRFTLRKEQGTTQPLTMPKRARILSVFSIDGKVGLDAEVYEDEDTRVFDRAHQRHFQLVMVGDLIPEGVLVGSVLSQTADRKARVYHLFEVRGRQGPGGSTIG